VSFRVELAALFGVSQGRTAGTEAGGTGEGLETGEGSTKRLGLDGIVVIPERVATLALAAGTRSRVDFSSKTKMVAKGAAVVLGSWTSMESSIGSTKVGKAMQQVSLEARK
jgi:hypothetical protein